MKKDDRILLSIFLIAGASGLTAFLLMNKFTQSTVVHYFRFCRQSLTTFFSSTSHLIGISVLALILLASSIAVITTSLSVLKTLKKLRTLRNSKSRKFQKRVNQAIKKVGISSTTVRIVENAKPIAFSLGFFRKTIILSNGLVEEMNNQELEAILLHELAHIKKNHPIKLALGKILSDIFFFIPVMKELALKYHVHIEVQADESVIEIQTTNRFLKSALAKVISTYDFPLFPTFGFQMWEFRIKKLNGERKQENNIFSKRNIQRTILIFIVAFALFLVPSESNAGGTEKVSQQQVCNDEICYAHCDVDTNLQEQLFTPGLKFSPSQ